MTPIYKQLTAFVLAVGIGGGGGLALANLWKNYTPDYIEGDYTQLLTQAGHPVIVLGTASCVYCQQTRAYLHGKGVAFADWDIDQSSTAAAELENLGSAGVPVLLIGNRQIRGFNIKAIDSALQQLLESSS